MSRRRYIRFRFDEKKTVQAAGLLLSSAGGYLNYMQLIKLLYLADREHLRLYGFPITGGSYAALPYGPVIEEVKERILETPTSYWSEHISPPADFEVKLLEDPGDDDLTDAEVEVLQGVVTRFLSMHPFELVIYTHKELPEWRDPEGSSFTIWAEDILDALGMNDDEIEAVFQSAVEREAVDQIFTRDTSI